MPDITMMVIYSTHPQSYKKTTFKSSGSSKVLLECKLIPSPEVLPIKISIKLNICRHVYTDEPVKNFIQEHQTKTV